jgi:adenine deaminase
LNTLHIQLVDLHQRRIYPAFVRFEGSRILSIEPATEMPAQPGYLMPGFIDAHVHIESSMLPPAEFGRLALVHGTVATVSDPHEIANVLGAEGVQFMLENALNTPLKCCFGAPSCVPATTFETAGDTLDADAVAALLALPEIGYLSEMMNFPGVLHHDEQVMAKIEAAKALGKPIDGHAPGLRGEAAKKYFSQGISTDHECFTLEEGREKALLGVKILIREGSAARNFEALWPLIKEFPDQVMFCSDDKHPDDLIQGHINTLAARAIAKGCDLFDTLRAACVHPTLHYSLPLGLLRTGDPADFILVKDLQSFEVLETWVDGVCVARNGASLLPYQPCATPNRFQRPFSHLTDFQIHTQYPDKQHTTIQAIQVWDGEIMTGRTAKNAQIEEGLIGANPTDDLLKIAVVNRYQPEAPVAIGFVCGFGLQQGALASSVAHDSHNIVAVGCDDQSLSAAVNAVIACRGGVSAADAEGNARVLALPIAGLMSPENGYDLAKKYADLDHWVKNTLGCPLRAPFMTLSFLALPVIPALKMTDFGLFDVDLFQPAFVEKQH